MNTKKIKAFLPLLLSLFMLSSQIQAASKPDKIALSLGLGFTQYAGHVERILSRYSEDKTLGRAAMHLDLLGLYWIQNNEKLLLGANLAADLDRLRVKHADFYFLNFHPAFSALYFPYSNSWQGVFLRTDAGLLRRMVAGDPHFEPEYYWGFSSLLALGFAWPMTNQTSLNVQFRYMPQFVDKHYESNLGLNLGVLF